MTKKYKKYTLLFGLLTILLNVCPLFVYVIKALCSADLVTEKVGLACTVFVVLILSMIAWVNKTTMRSRVWMIMLGLYFCLDNFIGPLIVIACTQIIDEWIMSPLHRYFKNKYIINKEIDKRMG